MNSIVLQLLILPTLLFVIWTKCLKKCMRLKTGGGLLDSSWESQRDLDGIKCKCSNVDDKLETLTKWLQSWKNTTWKALAEAMGADLVGRDDFKKEKPCLNDGRLQRQSWFSSMYIRQNNGDIYFYWRVFYSVLFGILTSAHPTCMLVRLIPQNQKISATSSFDLYGKKKRNCRPFVPYACSSFCFFNLALVVIKSIFLYKI